MVESRLLTGLPADSALQRLLELRGQRCTRQELRELGGPTWEVEDLAHLLRFKGIEARPVRIQSGDLDHLEMPTLLALEGGWLLLRNRTAKGLVVEGEAGSGEVDLPALAEAMSGWALECRPAMPSRPTLGKAAWALIRRHQATLLQVGAASLALQSLALLTPQFTRLAMDRAMPEGAGSLLGLVAMGMVAATLFQAWAGWLRQRTLLFLETRLEAGLAQDFLGHVLRLPFPFLQGRSLGDLLQAHSGLETARNLLTERVLLSLLDGVMALLYLGVMAATLPGPTFAVALAALAMAALVVLVGRRQGDLQREEVAAQIRERGYLVELLRGVSTVKAAGAEAPGLRRWLGLLREELRLSLRRQRVGLWSEVGLEGLRQALNVAILLWGGALVLAGDVRIGSLMAFIQMSGGFLGAVLGMSQAYLAWRNLKPHMDKISEYLEVEAEPLLPQPAARPLDGPVVLEDVWFRYGADHPWVLKGYHLQVEPGEKRWLHAPSGFGKSTLLRLVAGLYPPDRGFVTVGGKEPRDAKGQMIYLPQFVQLYGGSILENLRLLSGGAAHERLVEAAEASGLSQLVNTLPMGYNTVLPQGGGSLSGGQRQLVALTAVMASDRSLLLLDEAMANLDWTRRDWLRKSEWFRDKTVIYASHDAGLG